MVLVVAVLVSVVLCLASSARWARMCVALLIFLPNVKTIIRIFLVYGTKIFSFYVLSSISDKNILINKLEIFYFSFFLIG